MLVVRLSVGRYTASQIALHEMLSYCTRRDMVFSELRPWPEAWECLQAVRTGLNSRRCTRQSDVDVLVYIRTVLLSPLSTTSAFTDNSENTPSGGLSSPESFFLRRLFSEQTYTARAGVIAFWPLYRVLQTKFYRFPHRVYIALLIE